MKTLTPQILAMYLGSQFVLRIRDTDKFSSPMHVDLYLLKAAITSETHPDHIKPILCLRKLSSMTEEEALELYKIIDKRMFPFEIVVNRHPGASIDIISLDNISVAVNVGIDGTIVYYKEDQHGNKSFIEERVDYVKAFNYLRSKCFDVDNLIEDGLAIDRDTLNEAI